MVEKLAQNIIPENETQRLQALHNLQIAYATAEEAFDNITQLMAQVFGTPMAFISLVDGDKVFYKSQAGSFGKKHVLRQDSLCSLAILSTEPLVIDDASAEACFDDNPLVATKGGIRFYAGAPLMTNDGYNIGAVCVVDTLPRTFTEKEKELLLRFAKMVMHEIELSRVFNKQVETEEKLTTANKELQFVTDTMPQLVWATEPDGYASFFNKGWLQYTGLTFDDVKGDGWTQSLHPDDLERTFAAWRQALEKGDSYDVEYRLRRHDGVYRWFVARGTPMKDEQGHILKWYGSTTDIHDQKLSQDDLRESKERFDLVSKATQDAIWDWNLLTDDIWWNEGFKELFGYKDEDIEPDVQSWYGRVHPDDKDRVVGGIHQVIDNGGKLWAGEYRFRKNDGSYAIVFDRGYALHDADGKPYRMLGSMQDVTEERKQQEKRKQSEQRFQAAVAAVQGILWTNNAAGEMEGEQPGWQALTGQQYDQYKGYGWAAAVHPDDAMPTVQAWHEAVRERKTFVFEHRVKTKDGEWRLFSIRAIPVLNADGSVREWVGVHTDITEARQAEEKVRQSEKRFHNLIREATVGIVVLMGEEMNVAVVNDAYGRLIGRRADDLLNKRLFDIIPEAETTFRPVIDKVRNSGEPFYLYDQPYLVYANGKAIEGYLNLVYQPYRELDGATSGVMVLCHDITLQVKARLKAAEAEETARLAISSAELGTFDVDLRTNKIAASDRLDAIFDVAHLSERNRYIEAIHPDDLYIRNKAYEEAFQSGLLEYEVRVKRKDGSIRWIRVKGRVFFEKDKQPVKLVGVVQDISEEKQFAEELTKRVKEQTQELEQFTYVSHHDLQEPLRKITMFTDLVQAESAHLLSDTARLRLDRVGSAARRMSIALRDLLNFASLGKEEQFTEVNLSQTLAAVQTDLELAIDEKNAMVHVDGLPTIKAIPQQVHQLFYNLLNNALKFSKPGQQPVVKIHCKKIGEDARQQHPELSPTKQYYEIAVQDNGIGFGQSAAEKIFGLFQRLHNRDTYPGTGVGLALCRKVVQNHSGAITAEGEEGEGAIFRILLPVQP